MKKGTINFLIDSTTVNNNSPIQDYVHPDDQTQPFEMTPGFKPFTDSTLLQTNNDFFFVWHTFVPVSKDTNLRLQVCDHWSKVNRQSGPSCSKAD